MLLGDAIVKEEPRTFEFTEKGRCSYKHDIPHLHNKLLMQGNFLIAYGITIRQPTLYLTHVCPHHYYVVNLRSCDLAVLLVKFIQCHMTC